MPPFHPLFPQPDVATIAASFWPFRLDEARFPVETRLFHTDPETRILVHVQHPEGAPKAHCVLIHGLQGSSNSGYMRSMAQSLLEAGYAVHRMNIRSCGGSEFLCQTLYHAGLTSDIRAYLTTLDVERRTPVWLIAFSLGANQAVKYVGELGLEANRFVAGVCAVSTPIDLAACSRALASSRNAVYNWHYLRALKRGLLFRQKVLGDRWIPPGELSAIRTVYEFDDKVTGPAFGFRGADHYYETQSSQRFLARVRTPLLLVQAEDDPMIPFSCFSHPAIRGNREITLAASKRGGHIGFLARGSRRAWLDETIIAWIASKQ